LLFSWVPNLLPAQFILFEWVPIIRRIVTLLMGLLQFKNPMESDCRSWYWHSTEALQFVLQRLASTISHAPRPGAIYLIVPRPIWSSFFWGNTRGFARRWTTDPIPR